MVRENQNNKATILILFFTRGVNFFLYDSPMKNAVRPSGGAAASADASVNHTGGARAALPPSQGDSIVNQFFSWERDVYPPGAKGRKRTPQQDDIVPRPPYNLLWKRRRGAFGACPGDSMKEVTGGPWRPGGAS